MRLVMLGSPGSGKGTQAVVLAERLGIPHISTGEIFRENKAKQTELGKKVEAIMARGDLVPDSIVIEVVADRLGKSDTRERGFILDGFPRTVAQAEALGIWLEKEKMPLKNVVELDVDQEILVRRLSGRRHCAKCGAGYNVEFKPPRTEGRCDACGGELVTRADDSRESIMRRLEVDAEMTRPLHRFYEEKKVLVTVDGSKAPAAITDEILARLRAH
jgi:adenylate kinase